MGLDRKRHGSIVAPTCRILPASGHLPPIPRRRRRRDGLQFLPRSATGGCSSTAGCSRAGWRRSRGTGWRSRTGRRRHAVPDAPTTTTSGGCRPSSGRATADRCSRPIPRTWPRSCSPTARTSAGLRRSTLGTPPSEAAAAATGESEATVTETEMAAVAAQAPRPPPMEPGHAPAVRRRRRPAHDRAGPTGLVYDGHAHHRRGVEATFHDAGTSWARRSSSSESATSTGPSRPSSSPATWDGPTRPSSATRHR